MKSVIGVRSFEKPGIKLFHQIARTYITHFVFSVKLKTLNFFRKSFFMDDFEIIKIDKTHIVVFDLSGIGN